MPRYQLIPDQQSKETKIAVARYFAGALKGTLVEEVVFDKLREWGFSDENTIFGDCSCPDTNHHTDPSEDMSSLFKRRFSKQVSLAGKNGLQSEGRAGWASFSSQAPKNGNIMVMFAPHVSIDCNGIIGKVDKLTI